MPRLKAPSFVKGLGGRQSAGGYDGLESEASLTATAGASPDKENLQVQPLPWAAAEQEQEQLKVQQQQGSEQEEEAAVTGGSSDAPGSQSKANKPKKPWKGIGGKGKLRVGRSKISTWEESESETLRSPVTSPTTKEGESFAAPSAAAAATAAAAAEASNKGKPGVGTTASAAALRAHHHHQQQQQQGGKRHHDFAAAAAAAAPLFAAHKGADLQQQQQQQGDGTARAEQEQQRADIQLSRRQGDQGDNCWRKIDSTSSSDCEQEGDNKAASKADAGATASSGSASNRPGSEANGEPKTQQLEADGANKGRPGRKLKLRLRASLKRISSNLSRAFKHSDRLNAQVTLATPPEAAGDTSTATPPPMTVNVAAFKNIGGSISRDAEQKVPVNHQGAGYNALNASYEYEENSSSDDDTNDDVDEMSQPHTVARLTLSVQAPLRDGGFRPL